MSGQSIQLQTQTLLKELALGMRQNSLWAEQPLQPEALLSIAPFACDTMSFEQWLQFVYIPKLQELVDQQRPLPNKIAVLPMAEEVFKNNGNVAVVMSILGQLDNLLASQGH